jgi:tetratricopeptide (TPR) repeat protein
MTEEKKSSEDRLKIGFISDDPVLIKRFFGYVVYCNLSWQIKIISTLRIHAPSEDLDQYDILIYWYNQNTENLAIKQFLYTGEAPENDTSGGIIQNLKEHERAHFFLKRLVILSPDFTRSDVAFFALEGVAHIVTTPDDWKEAHVLNWMHMLDQLFRQILSRTEKGDKGDTKDEVFLRKIINWNTLTNEEQEIIKNDIEKEFKQSARYYSLLSEIALQEQNYDQAEQYLNIAITKNPNYLEAFSKLAFLLMQQNRLEEGMKIWNHLRNIVPNKSEYIKNLYVSYQKLNMRDNMERYLLKAIHLTPFDKDAIEEARNQQEKSKSPDLKQLKLNNLISSHASQETVFERAKEQFDRKDYRKSLSLFTRSLDLPGIAERSHEVFFMMGLNYSKLFQHDKAKKFFQLSLIRKPRYTKAMQALETLKYRDDKKTNVS